MKNSIIQLFRKTCRLSYLAFSMITLLVCVPFFEGGDFQIIILNIFVSMIFFFAVFAVSENRKNFIFALLLCIPWFATTWINIFLSSPSTVLEVISTVIGILFYAYIAGILLHFILKSEDVKRDVLYGAVSIYMLIGGVFGSIFSMIELILPGSFYINPAHNIDGIINWIDLLYYSYVTLTTLGYGDIIPVTSYARYTAILEAIIGVMFLAIIISRLVGLYISRSKEK